MGFAVTSFAYPFGSTSPTVEQTVADCGYTSGRGVGNLRSPGYGCNTCATAETIPPADRWEVRTNTSVQSDTTVDMLKQYVTQAENDKGGWVPLVFHHICTGCASNAIELAKFRTFVQWLDQRPATTQVRTVHQTIGGTTSPRPPPVTTSTVTPTVTPTYGDAETDGDSDGRPACSAAGRADGHGLDRPADPAHRRRVPERRCGPREAGDASEGGYPGPARATSPQRATSPSPERGCVLQRRTLTGPYTSIRTVRHQRRRVPDDQAQGAARGPLLPMGVRRQPHDARGRVRPRLRPRPSLRRQRLIMWPAMPSTASLTASDSVGCANTLRATSSAVRSQRCARVSAGSSSVTSGPIRWAPRISLYFASATIFTKPTRVAEALRLAVGGERELRDLDVVALLLGLLLGVAEGGDLRLAVRRPRDEVEGDRHRLGAGDRLGGDDAHRLGRVREHQLAGAVADRVDAVDVGAAAARRSRSRRGR